MKCWFGKVKNGKMKLNTLGKCVESFWGNIPEHYLSVKMDYYVIMPNHFHGIIILNNPVETGHAPSLRKGHNLGNVVGSFEIRSFQMGTSKQFSHLPMATTVL